MAKKPKYHLPKRPDMKAYFAARIDHHVHGMLARTTARMPQDVLMVIGDVTDRRITVVMKDETVWGWTGGEYASRKINGCYAPKQPTPVKPWWIRIERDEPYDDVMVGPYPHESIVKVAVDEALIIEGLMTDREGGTDCYTTQDVPGRSAKREEQVLIDLFDSNDTGIDDIKEALRG